MSAKQQQQGQASVEVQPGSLLDNIQVAPSERETIKEWLRTLIGSVMVNQTKWDRNVSKSITAGIKAIDDLLSKQLAEVMHAPAFQKLEGTWRGLHYLVNKSETGTALKIKVFNASKQALYKDLDSAIEFDQSRLFKKLYEDEFGMPGGEPYGALIGDYEFSNHPDDIDLLKKVSGVAAAAFCPFVTAPSAELFGLKSFSELDQPRDLAKRFDVGDMAAWRSFRESDDSRFVVMTMPRVLARLPYGSNTRKTEGFEYEEVELGTDGKPKRVEHDKYCWMNAAYVYGARLTSAFANTGWCTAITGYANGGKVEDLPAHAFKDDEGDMALKCPTEIAITGRRENELSNLGFMPLCHYKNTDYAVFFGTQTVQKPKKYEGKDGKAASDNAIICARLPYVMAVSRMTHAMKIMTRDLLGSFKELPEIHRTLTNWVANYVLADTNATPDKKARFPFAQAAVEVTPGSGPGSYNAVMHLRPWLMFEELNTSMRLVAEIPKKSG